MRSFTPRTRAAKVGLLVSVGLLGLGIGWVTWRSPDGMVAEPGTSILDRIDHVRVEAYPETNLPPEVAALASAPFRMRTREFASWEWIWGGLLPSEYGDRIPAGFSGVRFWHYVPLLSSRSEEAAPRIVRGDAELLPWNPEGEAFPGEAIWWDEEAKCLRAISENQPEGIRIEYLVDPTREFGEQERVAHGSRDPLLGGEEEVALEAKDLVGAFEIGNAMCRGLLLPAPGAVQLRVGELRADALSFVVGVLPRGYRVSSEDVLESQPSASDGVDLSVEISSRSGVERLFDLSIPQGTVGVRFHEARVDLSRYRGQAVEIRLVTDPGPKGDPSYDYAVWGRLRFVGGDAHPPDRPSVVLVDVDTLRPDRLGCYGYERKTTPRLDAWAAARATIYRDALATSSWTLPSTSSMRTGLAVHQHGAVTYPLRLPSETKGLASYLGERGYVSIGIAEGPYLGSGFGFDRGFDEYRWDHHGREVDWKPIPEAVQDLAGSRPFYLFLHTYYVHAPYPIDDRFEDPANPYGGWLVGREIDYASVIDPFLQGKLELGEADRRYVSRRYDAGVAQLDAHLGEFLERLERTFADRELLVVVTSDHGEEFFEHGGLSHSHSLYGELLRVPFLVRFPEGKGRGRVGTTDEPVTILDIVPTALDYAGVPIPAHLPGRSLRTEGTRSRVRVARMASKAAIQVGGMKLIFGLWANPSRPGDEEELYDLREDPFERRNLASERPEAVRRLKEILDRFERAYPPVGEGATGAVSESDLAILRNLGYLGGPQ